MAKKKQLLFCKCGGKPQRPDLINLASFLLHHLQSVIRAELQSIQGTLSSGACTDLPSKNYKLHGLCRRVRV